MNYNNLKRVINEALAMNFNQYKVFYAFATDGVRDDHYSQGNGIYRLSASLTIDESKKDKINSIVQELIEILSETSVIPSRITIYDNLAIEIDWAPNGFQKVRSKAQYLDLVLEFVEFLNEVDIYDLVLNIGIFDDDPDKLADSPFRAININPSFNSRCFGHDEIEVIDFR
jgi:hypothetical protein